MVQSCLSRRYGHIPEKHAWSSIAMKNWSLLTRIVYVTFGAAVLFGSFFITLWLTGPETADTLAADTKRLAAQRIVNYSELPKAAENVGLRLSDEQMGGVIDLLKRINEREVNMLGWLADRQGNSTPLNLLVFIDGSMVAAAQTKGERPDVTNALRLSSGAEKNVAFSFNFNCRPGDQPVVVGIGESKQYFPLQSKKCP
jgi:hypothetical protein